MGVYVKKGISSLSIVYLVCALLGGFDMLIVMTSLIIKYYNIPCSLARTFLNRNLFGYNFSNYFLRYVNRILSLFWISHGLILAVLNMSSKITDGKSIFCTTRVFVHVRRVNRQSLSQSGEWFWNGIEDKYAKEKSFLHSIFTSSLCHQILLKNRFFFLY